MEFLATILLIVVLIKVPMLFFGFMFIAFIGNIFLNFRKNWLAVAVDIILAILTFKIILYLM